jgi:hypothetical protein
MEAISSSEMSIDFQRTTWRYVPEDATLYNHRCDNIKCFNCLNQPFHYMNMLLVTKIRRNLIVSESSSF